MSLLSNLAAWAILLLSISPVVSEHEAELPTRRAKANNTDRALVLRWIDRANVSRAQSPDARTASGLALCTLEGDSSCQLPDQGSHGSMSVFLASSDSNPTTATVAADTFQVAHDGFITEVCWWGAYVDFDAPVIDCGPGPGDDFTITYFNNDGLGTTPGSIRAGPLLAKGTTKESTGLDYFGLIQEWQFSAFHDPVAVQAGECLWIQIQNNTTGTCFWQWAAAPPGDLAAAQDVNLDGYGPGDTLDFDLAWCLDINVESQGCGDVPGCGDADTGDCLQDNGTPFCSNGSCCQAVCGTNPSCCTVGWGAECAADAAVTPQCQSCTHTLELIDTGQDGWDGAALDVFVEGFSVFQDVTLDSGEFVSLPFEAQTGEVITTAYTPGSSETEHLYRIRDGSGVLIAADGPAPGSGVKAAAACPPISNDSCQNPQSAVDGLTPFSTIGALTDGPDYAGLVDCGPFGDEIVHNEVWFAYTASCEGQLTVSTCPELGGSANFDTKLAIHDGCEPQDCTADNVLGCNDDDPVNPCGSDFLSTLIVPVLKDQCYLLRVGSFGEFQVGSGELSVQCQGIVSCETTGDCADLDLDGIRDDVCTWWECSSETCAGTPIGFGDLGGSEGACFPDGAADGNDRFHALNCFSNQTTNGAAGYPCELLPPAAFNVDVAGLQAPCNPDGVCDGHDAFAAINVFENISTCTCDPRPQISTRAILRRRSN